MKTIIHLSDLHFGRTEVSLAVSLLETIRQIKPDLVVISGDLTQRAKISEFKQAKSFLASIPAPLFVIPGNHDIPLYRIWERLQNPYKNYKQYISPDLEPTYFDKEIAIKGINSVRPSKLKEGAVSRKQLSEIDQAFSTQKPKVIKIIVTHHPFNVPISHTGRPLKRARVALSQFQKTNVDILLAGHLHDDMETYRDKPFQIQYKGPLIIQAGTVISTRVRNVPNSFNVIRTDYPRLTLERYTSTDKISFKLVRKDNFIRQPDGWQRLPKPY